MPVGTDHKIRHLQFLFHLNKKIEPIPYSSNALPSALLRHCCGLGWDDRFSLAQPDKVIIRTGLRGGLGRRLSPSV